MKTLEILRKARSILATEDQWTQGWFARDASGKTCQAGDPQARRWCAIGAIRLAGGDTPEQPRCIDQDLLDAANVLAVAGFKTQDWMDVADLNDRSTFAEVQAAFDRAIEAAEEARQA